MKRWHRIGRVSVVAPEADVSVQIRKPISSAQMPVGVIGVRLVPVNAASHPGNYVKDCAVHKSFYRCVSIHGTHDVNVSRNVAYDVEGHCFYLEDGVEERNTFAFNLAALVHPIYENAMG
jgi:hypothetical protein